MMAIKTRKRSRQRIFFLYAISCCFIVLSFIFYNIAALAQNKINAFESMLDSLRDPFNAQELLKRVPNPQNQVVLHPAIVVSQQVVQPPVVAALKNVVLEKPKIILPNLNLTGVFYNTKRPLIILNGEVLGLGDRGSGVRVLSIRKGYVKIDFKKIIYTILIKD
ncbi:MAG: hypothetical protein WCI27_05925 [Candidatus Omnitrophota bacterium]